MPDARQVSPSQDDKVLPAVSDSLKSKTPAGAGVDQHCQQALRLGGSATTWL
jgi:hypothetical protein